MSPLGWRYASLMQSKELKLPPLTKAYSLALESALTYIFNRFVPLGVVVSGSIVRGNPDASSDFDIVVLHEEPWRQRVQKRFQGVPAEIFVNSPAHVRGYFEQESKAGRPIMAHMLASGTVVFSSSPQTYEIVALSRASLEKGPQFTEAELNQERYLAACLFEDSFDIWDRDPITAQLILSRATDAAIRYWYSSRQRFTVRAKEQLDPIRAEEPETARLIERVLSDKGSQTKRLAAQEIAERIIGTSGFFEWESEKE